MTLISAVKKEGNAAEIKFLIENDRFKAEVDNVYRKKAPNITIPGFRKGKAPRNMVEKMYGKGFCYEEAINNLLDKDYVEALTASGLEVVSRPEIDIENIDENGVTVIANVKVKPEVTLESYKGLKATKKVEEVTEEEITAEIEKVRERNSRTIEVTDRAAEIGDTVTIDYSGSVDGVKFEGGTAEEQTLVLGSNSFISGFEEQVAGHKIGESFDINVTFPTEYHAPELAGKQAVFAIVLHKIEKTELPEVDDDFAKDVSEFDTLAEYKADVTSKIKSAKEAEAERDVGSQLTDALLEGFKADIPSEMIEAETENFVRDFDNRLRMNGLDLKTYFQYTGLTLEALREQMKPDAEKQVKTRLALEKVAELEKIEITAEEIESECESIAKAYDLEVSKVKELFDEKDIKTDISLRKAVDFIKANADISEEKGAKKAAKKTTKKKTEESAETAEAPSEEKKPAKRTTKKKAEEPQAE